MPLEDSFNLVRINASAGAGKTYSLTRRFLGLLRQAEGPGSVRGCLLTCPERTFSLQEILAATFTNKAAAEMKGRIIRSLKEEALAEGEDRDTPFGKPASYWVSAILRHYHELNVRTIDSLLSNLVRLSSLELGLPSDFDLFFDPPEYFTPIYDGLMDDLTPAGLARAEFITSDGVHLAACLERSCQALLYQQTSKGFFPGDKLHDSIFELVERLMAGNGLPDMEYEQLKGEILGMHRALCVEAVVLKDLLLEEGLSVSRHFLGFLDKCIGSSPYSPVKGGKQAEKSCLDDCLNKASRSRASSDAEKAFSRFRSAALTFDREFPLLFPALQLAPQIALAREVFARMEQAGALESRIPLARIPALARQALNGQSGVTDALCRLGSRITHLLLDEFQDTSAEQWEAIRPLAEECLANNGSVTYVGDVKQAIYSWRGGDTRLFESAVKDPLLNAVAGGHGLVDLPYNWRSGERIISHNNAFFSLLADHSIARRVLSEMLPPGTPDRYLDSAVDDCVRIFSGATQSRPPQGERPEPDRADHGVCIYRVGKAPNEQANGLVRDRLKRLLEMDLLKRRPYSDLAVLVRSSKEAGLVAEWLSDWDIPVVTENSLRVRDHPAIQEILSLLAFLDYPLDDLSFWSFIAGGHVFGPSSGLRPEELADWLAGQTLKKRPPLFRIFRERFPREWSMWLAPLLDQAGLMSAYDLIMETMKRYSLLDSDAGQEPFLRRFLEIAYLAEKQGHSSLASFLSFWNGTADGEKLPLPENMDAIRILTMHKAKGLEFPVVILPFSHRGKRGTPKLCEVSRQGQRLMTRSGKHVEDHYYPACVTEELERLNLLYVAWTRPTCELHVFIASPAALGQQLPMARGLEVLIDCYRETHGESLCRWEDLLVQEDPEDPSGQPEPSLPGPPESLLPDNRLSGSADAPGPDLYWRPMQWLPRLKIFRSTLEGVEFTAARRGSLAHLCLEQLVLTDPRDPVRCRTDVDRAVRMGMRLFPLPVESPDVAEREIRDCLYWFVSLPRTWYWLARGLREQSIMNEQGAMFRTDLLVVEDERLSAGIRPTLRVVDYKTGRAAPQDPLHHAQVSGYMTLLEKAQELPVAGTLVYLDERRLEEVAP